MQALVDSSLHYDDEIRRSGHYIVSDALQPARTARTIRVRVGTVSATDGPSPRRNGRQRAKTPASAAGWPGVGKLGQLCTAVVTPSETG